VVIGVYATLAVSGGHLNPAVTVSVALFRQFPWRHVPVYVAAQLLGAFLAAGAVYANYRDALAAYDGGARAITGPRGTAGAFVTLPAAFLSPGAGVLDELLGTALLLFAVFAVTDPRNAHRPPHGLVPLACGAAVLCVLVAFGFNAGAAVNPARDLGPRLWTLLAYGPGVFTVAHRWALTPALAPLLGGPLGAAVYELGLGRAHR
jgi:MIP family channel proteins